MQEVLALTIQLAASIALPAFILRRDIARLEGRLLSRSWPDASLWSAVVAFGPLCLPIHFVRTRRSLSGVALGLVWFSVALLGSAALSWLVEGS